MAVIIGTRKMVITAAGGNHTIFPSAAPQSLPDHLFNHPQIKGAIKSGWVTVVHPPEVRAAARPQEVPQQRRRRN